ncbi:BMP family ABC transporter substrate-binding protein [Hydrogenoanaerobacterium sp.]|uniref:BMP family ABC transporter substrate-binding protein n=1 Tax=Hydrogenoanaerobacterium sp. TaxID=2953763 RepID=UPI00289E5D98|nr:BMP family ABC transporter substrate-binding protein [Hydrogenoanaerobacterium sp.]
MKKVLAIMLAVVLAVTVMAGCAPKAVQQAQSSAPAASPDAAPAESAAPANKAIAKEDIKVGFLYVGPVGDEGYSYAHDQGRKELETKLGVKTMFVENVPETADCEAQIRSLIDQGCNVIYATSFGHMKFIDAVAKDYPDLYFGHATGFMTEANMSNYMGRIYEARYLSGIAAGMNTKNGQIGYVAAMKTAEVIRGINAFTLGVRSVNPTATVEVKWTNSWYDPAVEKATAVDLLNKGCDVIAQHCDTTGPQVAAQEKGAKCVGYNAPTISAAPKAYLTAPLFHWGTFYCNDVQSIIDGTWAPQSYWEGIKSGMVSLDALSENNVAGTKEKVEEAQAKIVDGSMFVFSGEIKDNEGKVKVAAGEKMTDEQMLAFDWFVEGVIGSAK